MKWIAVVLAAIVFATPLGFAEAEISANSEAEASAVTATGLRFRQIGQAFGDFVFEVRNFLTFGEEAKVELIKERNAHLQERQEAWLEAKAEALEDFKSDLSAEEKSEIRSMVQAEHEAIVKEHLRLTSQLREIQLKAKAEANAQLESEAEAAAESGSSLSLGLVRTEINGEGSRALLIGKAGNTKIHVQGNIVLDSETKAAVSQLAESFSAEQDAKVEIEVEKEAGANASVEHEVSGELTAEQQTLLANLEAKAEALVEASASAAKLEIEIRHKAAIENRIDTAAEAQAVVEKKLGIAADSATTETRNGVEVFVVTGSETQTRGGVEMTKSFEVVIAENGLILSADLMAHFEQTAQAEAGSSASSSSSVSTSGSASSNAGVSAGTSSSADVSAGNSGSGSASASSAVGVTIG